MSQSSSSPRRKASGKVFGWQAQLDVGEFGCRRLVRLLREKGRTVTDVTNDKDWQRRDVDLIVNGVTVEVKTDTHDSGNVFFEVRCGKKPGCLFKSRAEYWAYWIVPTGRLYFIPLADVQLWLLENAGRYKLKKIVSSAQGRQWEASGYAIPIRVLRNEIGVAAIRLGTDDAEQEQEPGDGLGAESGGTLAGERLAGTETAVIGRAA